jgi:hypothetical protein
MGLNKTKAPPKEKAAINATVVKDFLDLLDKIGGIENFPESVKVWKSNLRKYEVEDCISAEEIAVLYRHDDDGNVFNIKTGIQVGYLCKKSGYLRIGIYYKHYKFDVSLAKIVFCLYHGRWAKKDYDVDHKDNDKLNNRPSNLRECSKPDHVSNRRLLKKTKSGVKGVKITKYSIVAIVRHRKKVYQKYFSNKTYGSQEEAIIAAKAWRDATARELHGEFFNEN